MVMKYITFICVAAAVLMVWGCTKKTSSLQKLDEPVSDDGYKPAVMYHEEIFWLGVDKDKCVSSLPNGYRFVGEVKETVQTRMELPKKNLEGTHAMKKGAQLYYDGNSNVLLVKIDDSSCRYVKYNKNQKE